MKAGSAYLRPPAAVEGAWIDADDPQIRSRTDAEALWWQQVDDAVLSGLVLQASNQNLPLRAVGFRVLAARAAYTIKVGGFCPQSQDELARYNRIQFSENVGALSNLSTTAFRVFSTGFNLSWELDLWARSAGASSRWRLSIRPASRSATACWRRSWPMWRIATRDYRVAEKQVADLRRLAEIQRQSRLTSNALCLLLGIPSTELAGRLGQQDIPQPPAVLEAGIPADLLNHGRLLNNIRNQDALFQSLAARYRETVLRAGREAEDGMITFLKARHAAAKQREALAAATRSTELVQVQDQGGTADFNRVFVVRKNEVDQQSPSMTTSAPWHAA